MYPIDPMVLKARVVVEGSQHIHLNEPRDLPTQHGFQAGDLVEFKSRQLLREPRHLQKLDAPIRTYETWWPALVIMVDVKSVTLFVVDPFTGAPMIYEQQTYSSVDGQLVRLLEKGAA